MIRRRSPVKAGGTGTGHGAVYLVTVASSLSREGQTAGCGFIGLATVIFGNGNPWSVTFGSLVFGFTDALRTPQELIVGVLLVGLGVLFGALVSQALLSRLTPASNPA